MKNIFCLLVILAFSKVSFASDAVSVVAFLKELVPQTTVYVEYYGTEKDSSSPCKLMVDYRDASENGIFKTRAQASATLWVNREGSNWPVKYDVEDQSSHLEFQYANIDENSIEAQTVVVPNDQYSSKERQTLRLTYDDSTIQVSVLNEQKGWFGYKTKYKATCLLQRN